VNSNQPPDEGYPEHYHHHSACDCEPCLTLLDKARHTLAQFRARGNLYAVPAPLPRPDHKKT